MGGVWSQGLSAATARAHRLPALHGGEKMAENAKVAGEVAREALPLGPTPPVSRQCCADILGSGGRAGGGGVALAMPLALVVVLVLILVLVLAPVLLLMFVLLCPVIV